MTSITEGQSVGGVAPMLQKLKNVHKFTSLSKKELFNSSFEQFLLKFHLLIGYITFQIFLFLRYRIKKEEWTQKCKTKEKEE